MPHHRNRRPSFVFFLLLPLLLVPSLLFAQTGTVTGRVTQQGEAAGALSDVRVTVVGTSLFTLTGNDGRYTLKNVPAGPQTLSFRWIGYQPTEAKITVAAGQTTTADVTLSAAPVSMGELVVEGASRAPERQVEAPAAISVVEPQIMINVAPTGQAPMALTAVPGVDVVQNGVNDFNVNARGFNSSLNRRVLVLQDGRDLSIAFLGSQEWNGIATTLDEMGSIEVVRGPGSALYGANAFSGVINITTPTAREVAGTKVALGGGELSTFRGDLRHAGVLADGRLGYKVMAGYNRSDTWTRSRTSFDRLDLAREYADATDEPVGPNIETVTLKGQEKDPVTGTATGDRDALENYFGTARVDYYAPNGHVITGEGSYASVANEVFVTGIGRVQILGAAKAYGRVMYAAPRFNVMAWWNHRDASDSTGNAQRSLSTGAYLFETSNIYHVEGQVNQNFDGDRGRVVAGASYRSINVNTYGTLMNLADDDRGDHIASAYGQVEYKLHPQVRLVGALRFDDGNLFAAQFSPKAAIVYSPSQNHSLRLSMNRAFMTPNYSEWFLQVAAGAPVNFSALEAGLRANPQLGPLLAGVPQGTLFSPNSGQVPVLALGNRDLVPEETLGWEVGYKGNITNRFYVSVDLYTATLKNFVTDLLPGVNPNYGAWQAPETVPVQGQAALEAAVQTVLLSNPATALAGKGLTTLDDGSSAIVVSYTNAGRVQQYGMELGAGYQFSDAFRLDASFTPFGFDVKEQLLGDQLVANTPSKKATLAASYISTFGLDASAQLRLIDGYQWAAGVFVGYVPAQEILNASVGYRFNNYLRLSATATNLLDQQQFSLYGGAVVGRRVLAQVEANF
ncbi:MAG TPA: TonB-dependent receptor [Gemmatimonadales bacterium]|nr:TonB-dependent receptor [Gemmatimonadales bacterium]